MIHKAKTTFKETQREFNNTWVKGDLIHSGNKCYIHPQNNSISVKNELCKCIIMHEVIPETICRGMDGPETVIWENDMYEWTNPAYGKCTGIVKFGDYLQDGSGGEYSAIPCHGFYMEIVDVKPFEGTGLTAEDYPTYLRTVSVLTVIAEMVDVKITGNIFDKENTHEKR